MGEQAWWSDLQVVAVPLRVPFRGIDVRYACLLEGSAGWAEFSPFLEYEDAEAIRWLAATREAAERGWPTPVREQVPVNATVPAVPAVQVGALLAAYGPLAPAGGGGTAKVKVGEPMQTAGQDLARLEAVRDHLGPSGRVRIDVNGAWSVREAVRLLPRYAEAAGGLEYVEQPCATVPELAAVRQEQDVLVAADESIRRAEDPMRVVEAGAADILVLKVQPLGGVRACLRLAEQAGLAVVVSSALETSVGLAAGVALAAALPELPYACGLATARLLAEDVTDEALVPALGALSVRSVLPSPARLRRLQPEQAMIDWWEQRVRRVQRLTEAAQ